MASMMQKVEDTLKVSGGDPKKVEEKHRAAEEAKHKKEAERLHGEGGGGIVEKVKAKVGGGVGDHKCSGGVGGAEKHHGEGGGIAEKVKAKFAGGEGEKRGDQKFPGDL